MSATNKTSTTLGQFYRRPLPPCCISFCSDEGKTIFREALLAGHMETYFPLAAQFCTQEEPAFCGLSTLVMVLNALEVDPKKVWKGPWRWYHEQMLDCCVPIEVIEKSGITFDQFACLAICNTLDVHMFRIDSNTSEQQFRELVIAKTRCANEVVVVSYSRRAVQQTGDGHFSPLGGYHPNRDLVLIFDVARFKYPPHWISVSLLYEAMKCVDKATNLPRGYMLLTKSPSLPTVLFRFSALMSVTRSSRTTNPKTSDVIQCIEAWQNYLKEPLDCQPSDNDTFLAECVTHLIDTLDSYGHEMILLTTQVDGTSGVSEEHKRAICDLVQVIESLQMFSVVSDVVNSHSTLCQSRNYSNNTVSTLCHICLTNQIHYLTIMLLLWPYGMNVGSRGSYLRQLVGSQMESCTGNGRILLHNEVRQLRQQLESVLGYVSSCCNCSCKSKTIQT